METGKRNTVPSIQTCLIQNISMEENEIVSYKSVGQENKLSPVEKDISMVSFYNVIVRLPPSEISLLSARFINLDICFTNIV